MPIEQTIATQPLSKQDEWVLGFVVELMALGYDGGTEFMALLGRELQESLAALPPQQAALSAYLNLRRTPSDRREVPRTSPGRRLSDRA